MNNPFIDTMLYATVALHPSQLNNNIYSNLKQNLIEKYERKCYKDYGYICKIYEIIKRDNGILIPEDLNSSAIFKVKFSCRLCHPLENTQIICKVNQTTDLFISLVSEPIHIIVTTDNDRINGNVFYKDQYEKKIKNKKTNETLEHGSLVKATILSKAFVDKDRKIIAIGRLDDIATDKEIEQFYTDAYSQEKKFVELDDYTHTSSPSIPKETSVSSLENMSDKKPLEKSTDVISDASGGKVQSKRTKNTKKK